MKRHLILTAMTIALLGGAASADHRHGGWGRGGGGWGRGGGSWGHAEGRWHGGWNAGVVVRTPSVRWSQPRVIVRPQVRVSRRPIYVRAPVIRYHYYDYYSQPTVIAENYPAMDGYYWVAGQWQWNGYEWIWVAGHYDNDPNYGYYNNGYYQPSSYQPCD